LEKVSLAMLKAADKDLPRPRRLPTIAKINWSAFPDDREGPYGKSGRQIMVRPGKPGAIADALARAGEGDLIVVRGGLYKEGLEGDDGALRIKKKGIILRSMPREEVRVVPRAAETQRGILIEASYVIVHGISLEGFSAMGIGVGKFGQTLQGVILSEIKVKAPPATAWVDGIIVWPDHSGGDVPAVDGLLLRKVSVQGASLGISCNAGPCKSLWLEQISVYNTRGAGSGADSIAVERGENIVLKDVVVTGATADGIDLKTPRVLITGARVHHVRRNGIKLWYGGDIINSLVHHTGADASVVLGHGRYRLLNTVVAFHNYDGPKSYCFSAGYGETEPVEVELTNTIVYKTSGGMYFSDNTNLKINNCIFFGMQNRKVLQARSRGRQVFINTNSSPKAFERAGLGRNNSFSDPQFSEPAEGNYRLRRGSPGVDRGVISRPFPETDLAENPRVKGKAPDLGPYESY